MAPSEKVPEKNDAGTTRPKHSLRDGADDALRESEQKFRSLYTHMNEGAALYNLTYNDEGIPEDYIIIETNPAFEKQLGISRDTVIGKTSRVAYGVAEPPYLEIYARVALTGESMVFETYFPPLAKHFSISAYCPYKGSFATVFEDITERKRAEEALRESEHKFRDLFENSRDGIVIAETATQKFFDSNTMFSLMLGYNPEEIKNLGIRDIYPEDTLSHVFEAFEKMVRHETNIAENIPVKRKDGTVFYTDISAYPISVSNKGYLVRVFRDVTERKEAEEVIRESEEKFRQLFTRMPSAVAIYDAVDNGEDFIFKDFNATAEKIEGMKKDDLVGKRITHVFPGVKDFGLFAVVQRVWRTGQPEYFPSALYRDERNSGTWRENWVYRLASGEVVIIYNDITERKQAEEKISNLQAFQESVIANANIWITVLDPTGTILVWNDAAEAITGYKRGDVLGKRTIWKDLYPDKAYRDKVTSEIFRIIGRDSYLENFETEIRCADMTQKAIVWNTRGIRDPTGTIRSYIAISRDITEQKRAEEALKKSQIQLAEAMDLAHLVNWEFDVATGIFTFDDRFYSLYGTTAELEGSNQIPADVYAKKFVHPDDQYIVANEVNKAIQTTDPGYVSQVEHRIIRRDGEIRHIVVRFGITKDANGRTIRTHGGN